MKKLLQRSFAVILALVMGFSTPAVSMTTYAATTVSENTTETGTQEPADSPDMEESTITESTSEESIPKTTDDKNDSSDEFFSEEAHTQEVLSSEENSSTASTNMVLYNLIRNSNTLSGNGTSEYTFYSKELFENGFKLKPGSYQFIASLFNDGKQIEVKPIIVTIKLEKQEVRFEGKFSGSDAQKNELKKARSLKAMLTVSVMSHTLQPTA